LIAATLNIATALGVDAIGNMGKKKRHKFVENVGFPAIFFNSGLFIRAKKYILVYILVRLQGECEFVQRNS